MQKTFGRRGLFPTLAATRARRVCRSVMSASASRKRPVAWPSSRQFLRGFSQVLPTPFVGRLVDEPPGKFTDLRPVGDLIARPETTQADAVDVQLAEVQARRGCFHFETNSNFRIAICANESR